MGRCYEFGVSLQPGCDHAMVVVDEGGACQCVGCGIVCRGKFAGCAQIVSRPGYVPVLAPRRALTRPKPPEPVAAPVTDVLDKPIELRMPAAAPPSAADIERRHLERQLLEQLRNSGTAVDDLRSAVQELALRINDLEASIKRLETAGIWDLLK